MLIALGNGADIRPALGPVGAAWWLWDWWTPEIAAPPQMQPPPAPQTRMQMEQPGEWTPAVVRGIQTQQALTFKDTGKGGVATVPTGPSWWDQYKWWIVGGGVAMMFALGAGGMGAAKVMR